MRRQAPLAGTPAGTAKWPQENWWKRYQDPQLDRLMALATRDSPDLQEAQARYSAAERAVAVQEAQLRPQLRGYLDAGHAYSKADIHAQPSIGTTTQNIQLSPRHSWSNSGLAAALFTWDLDLWGKQKDAVAEALGQANAARAERAMAADSLHYNVARTYFDWQIQQARLALAKDAARDASRYRELVALRVHAGLDDPQTIDQADAQLAEQLRSEAQVEGSISLDQVQLAAVIGVSEQELGSLQAHALPVADTDIPPYAGLELIARRPDIVADRWQIEASIKGIDSARAAYYPDVSLMGLGAYLQLYPNLGSGTQANVALANIGPSVSLPIFSGGRLKAQLESRQAELDSAVAAYNSTVVQAAHDVAEQIATLQQLQAEQIQTDRQVADVSTQNGRANHRRRQGLDDDRTWLGLQMQLDQQRDTQVQLSGQLLATNLALIHALGGGYHAADLPSLPANATAQDASR
ncbi:hypothetical protein GCM10027066_00410 [Dyella jejuensis]